MLVPSGGCALIAGDTGILRSTELELGTIYLGSIRAAALLLYEGFRPHPAAAIGRIGIVFVAVFRAVFLGYRRSRYVETSPVKKTSRWDPAAAGRAPLREELLVRFQKIFTSAFRSSPLRHRGRIDGIVRDGWSNMERDLSPRSSRADISALALVAVCLLLLFYPLLDSTAGSGSRRWKKTRPTVAVLQGRDRGADEAVETGRRRTRAGFCFQSRACSFCGRNDGPIEFRRVASTTFRRLVEF